MELRNKLRSIFETKAYKSCNVFVVFGAREMPEPLYEWLEEETGLRSKFRMSSVASVESD